MDDITLLPSLDKFPPIPRAGKITVAESHSELHALPSEPENPSSGKGFCASILHYNAVDGHQLTTRLPFKIPSIKIATNRTSLILKKNQGISKSIWDSWWEEGIKGVYQCLLDTQKNDKLPPNTKTFVKFLSSLTSVIVSLCEAPSKILVTAFPHLDWKVESVNDEFSRVRGWKESWVRAMAWHPTAAFLALALSDDSVRVCVVGNEVVPMLRCQEQRNVSSMSWRPYVFSELAVGSEDCIIIWHLTSSVSMKPGKDKTMILKVPGHGPVNCVEYSSTGTFLLSSSAKDSSVYIWDAVQWGNAALRRIAGGGIPLALWSPKADRLLAASPNNVFWVWENKEYWDCRRWMTPTSMIESACWSPNGSVLLFATNGFVYGIFFELSPIDQFVAQTDSIVKPIFNIGECHVLDEDGNLSYKVGGKVRHMEWDSSGHRVAITFDDSEMVALFRVLPQSRTEYLAPMGFIRGHPDEFPRSLGFQKEFSEGALLTIGWSSGRIQYFPLIFALPTNQRNILHEDNYRAQQVVQSRPSSFAAAGFVSPRLSMSGAENSHTNVSELFKDQDDVISPSRLYSINRHQ